MKKVLVVVDMQNDFIDGALGTQEAQAIVGNVVKKIEEYQGEKVFATRDTHGDNYMNTSEGKHLPVPHCLKGTEGWEIRQEVLESLQKADAEIVDKPFFGSMVLVDKMAEQGFQKELEIELVGLCTDICVVSNALLLKARLPEAIIRVDKSCCAGVTPQSHEAALLTMKMCHIDIH